jgi:hypothetical protein
MEAAWDQQADRSPSGVQYARHRPEETTASSMITTRTSLRRSRRKDALYRNSCGGNLSTI